MLKLAVHKVTTGISRVKRNNTGMQFPFFCIDYIHLVAGLSMLVMFVVCKIHLVLEMSTDVSV